MTTYNLLNAAKYYAELPHQDEAWKVLEERLPAKVVEEFLEDYRNAPESPTEAYGNPLTVAYEYQNDNASGEGYRECFSSSCAMLARYWGKVTCDDEYNKIRARYGDSTDANAQLSALKSLGLSPVFLTNGTTSELKLEIDEGRPVAVGWLHKGTVKAPTGGGHWSVVVGWDKDSFILHDPNGEANLISGGYINYTGGEYVHYSYKNWVPRWEVVGGDGWYLTCRP